MTENTRGALFMMASMGSFTINDAFMKSLAGHVPFFQALFLRGCLTVLFIAVLAWATGRLRPGPDPADRGLVALRTLAELGAAYFFITALFNMPIANATAIIQALPLTVTLAGWLFLGEPVGWRRLTAILVGFIGVLMIVQPGSGGFSIYSLYALAAVVCVTARDLASRRIGPGTPSVQVALVAACGVTAMAAVGATFTDWVPLVASDGATLLAAAAFVIGGYVFSVATMRVGDIGAVAPFRYTSLLFALVLGWAVFGEWPDALTIAGSATVVATGLFTLYRERSEKRRLPKGLRLR